MKTNPGGNPRGICYKQQNQTTKNENGAQKNAHIFKNNAWILLKLGLGFDHMYTKGWNFFAPHGIRRRAKVP